MASVCAGVWVRWLQHRSSDGATVNCLPVVRPAKRRGAALNAPRLLLQQSEQLPSAARFRLLPLRDPASIPDANHTPHGRSCLRARPCQPTGLHGQTAITHSFLALGSQTRIVDGTGKTTWSYPHATRRLHYRQPFVHALQVEGLPAAGGGDHRDGQKLFEWKGAGRNTAQVVESNRIWSRKPVRSRACWNSTAPVRSSWVPISCQLTNHHMQSRMVQTQRQLPSPSSTTKSSANTPKGEIVWEVRAELALHRHHFANGNTLISTYGHVSIGTRRANHLAGGQHELRQAAHQGRLRPAPPQR